jgi:DNA-binding CsgD family transcriptional regulator
MRASLPRQCPACRSDVVLAFGHSFTVDHDHWTGEVGMAAQSPYQVRLTADERSELESVSRRASAQSRLALRARIVLAAADGASNAAIAERLDICVDTVRKWRMRFRCTGFEELRDLPRSGRPRMFAVEVVAEIEVLACELPAWVGAALTGVELSGTGT